MQRYFIYLAYDGTNYHGWQIQPNGITVQQRLEEALSMITRKEIKITGAGRTDTGVHAKLMVAHFDVSTPIKDLPEFTERLNRILPKDIAIFKTITVKSDAHARFDATSRTYKYYVTDCKDPFNHQFSCKLHGQYDFDKMNQAANALFDYTDFTSFSKLHTDVKTNNCKIMQAYWVKEGDMWVFTIQADRFLRNMVRAIVGTLLEVGRGRMDIEGFRGVIEHKERCKAGSSAPGNALFLVDIAYPQTIC